RAYFETVAAEVKANLKGNEDVLVNFRAEDSTFLRFNRSAVRQPGQVREIELALDLIDGKRHAESGISLSGEIGEDRSRIARSVAGLRDIVADVPEAPYLLVSETIEPTERTIGAAPEAATIIDAMVEAGQGRDLVGFAASGPVWTGFANGRG